MGLDDCENIGIIAKKEVLILTFLLLIFESDQVITLVHYMSIYYKKSLNR